MNSATRSAALGAATALALAAAPATATEWFVATNGLDSADGQSEATAFLTIQHAVDAAGEGDVVTVLPGIYDSGKTTVYYDDSLQCHQRVFIGKKALTLRSRDGASATHIVGAWDATPSSVNGMGNEAVRCIGITNAATAVRIQGFTIRDGASRYASNGGDKATNRAGGVLQICTNPTPEDCSRVVVEDCVLSGNVGTRGGAIYGITAVRCRIVDNRASNFGAAARQCRLYNCLVARNAPTTTPADAVGAIAYGYDAVNCTVAYNECDAFRLCDYNAKTFNTTTETEKILNCVIVGNRGYVANASISKVFNSVVELNMTSNSVQAVNIGGTFNTVYVAPAAGDYRLVSTTVAVTRNPATNELGNRIAEFLATDIDGNEHAATPLCGCYAEAVTPAGAGWVWFEKLSEGTIYVDGVAATATKTNYLSAAVWPKTYNVTYVPADGRGLVCWTYDGGARFPTLAGDFHLLPSSGTKAVKFAAVVGNAVYVSPEGDDDTGDGTKANPWKTLQKGADIGGRLVIAAAGTYDTGGAVASGLSARVALTNAAVRIIAPDGPEKTIIAGAADPSPVVANDLGLGPNAVRCVYVGASQTAVQGFTLTGGHTSITANDGDDGTTQLVRGGAMCSIASVTTSAILDCIVTNNCGSRGAAVFGGTCERCLFAGNAFTTGGNGVTRETTLRSCIVTGHANAKPPVGQHTLAYNVTVAGNALENNAGMIFGNVDSLPTAIYNGLIVSNEGGNDLTLTNAYYCVYEDASDNTKSLAPASNRQSSVALANIAGYDFRPYSTSAAIAFAAPGYWAGRNMADFAGEAFRVVDGVSGAKIAAGALGGSSGIVPAVVIATNRPHGGVDPIGEVAITGEALTVAATQSYRIETVEIGERTVEVNGTAFTVTAEEALAFAPLSVTVNLYPSPFVLTIR